MVGNMPQIVMVGLCVAGMCLSVLVPVLSLLGQLFSPSLLSDGARLLAASFRTSVTAALLQVLCRSLLHALFA